ncbi:MAG: tetratricopeptide repeat protein [Candidatus Omnitrophica bacterium]|nr:tetratricopeptide repeat protein [Candidatus Omnitrophota bacterium]
MSIFGRLFRSKPNASGAIFNRFLLGLVLVLTLAGQTLYAQQSDTNVKKLAEIRAKAEKGDAEAQWELGKAFSNGEFGLEKDQQEAVKWYRKSAEQNFASAQVDLGFCYMFGKGVEQEQQEAVKWWRKAAEQNNVVAQTNLGACYCNGNGVAIDYMEAMKWYRKAAEQNYAPAQTIIGNCYYSGILVAKDDVEAVKWWRKAAEQNDAPAQAEMGESYFKGTGVAKDMAEAYKWFLLAIAQGEEGINGIIKKRVRHLEKKLEKDQIVAVKKQVDEWVQQHKKATN